MGRVVYPDGEGKSESRSNFCDIDQRQIYVHEQKRNI